MFYNAWMNLLQPTRPNRITPNRREEVEAWGLRTILNHPNGGEVEKNEKKKNQNNPSNNAFCSSGVGGTLRESKPTQLVLHIKPNLACISEAVHSKKHNNKIQYKLKIEWRLLCASTCQKLVLPYHWFGSPHDVDWNTWAQVEGGQQVYDLQMLQCVRLVAIKPLDRSRAFANFSAGQFFEMCVQCFGVFQFSDFRF